jgi:hypothetical protein
MAGMDLFLRKVDHVQAKDNYRVILKTEEGELEIGSIGIQYHAGPDPLWIWGIDTVIPMREFEDEGQRKDRADCMKRFKAAWTKFASDEEADRVSSRKAQTRMITGEGDQAR